MRRVSGPNGPPRSSVRRPATTCTPRYHRARNRHGGRSPGQTRGRGGNAMEAARPSFDYGGRTGYEPIPETDRKEFHEQGFLLLRNVLTEEHRAALEAAVDRVYAEEKAAGHTTKDGTLHLLGF